MNISGADLYKVNNEITRFQDNNWFIRFNTTDKIMSCVKKQR